jgi:hypothetical protein
MAEVNWSSLGGVDKMYYRKNLELIQACRFEEAALSRGDLAKVEWRGTMEWRTLKALIRHRQTMDFVSQRNGPIATERTAANRNSSELLRYR